MARFLLGEEPAEIQVFGSALIDPKIGAAGDVDTAAVLLRTETGKLCQISNSRRAAYGYDQRIEVHGSKGLLRADNQLENTVEVADKNGFQRAVAKPFFLTRYEAAFRLEMEHFVDAITSAAAPSPNCNDGYRAQLIADAAAAALRTGKKQLIQPQKIRYAPDGAVHQD